MAKTWFTTPETGIYRFSPGQEPTFSPVKLQIELTDGAAFLTGDFDPPAVWLEPGYEFELAYGGLVLEIRLTRAQPQQNDARGNGTRKRRPPKYPPPGE